MDIDKVYEDHITIVMGYKEVIRYTEPENVVRKERAGRRFSNGTVPHQVHDPKSKFI